jgi:IS4 transposase
MNKDTNKSTFKQLFSVLSQQKKRLEEMEPDRHWKKMSTLQFIELMMTSQMDKEPALRDISNSLNNEDLSSELGLPSISASQVSRRQRELDTIILKTLFADLIAEFARKRGFNSIKKTLGNIYMIDSTTITLCLTKYRWAEFRSTKAGVKAHLRLKFGIDGNLPDKVVITPAKPSDRSQMDELVVDETGALNLFDRGYNDYTKFDEYSEKGVLFITRLKSNAVVEVIADNTVDPQGAIFSDQIVRLGTGDDRMKNPLRLLKTIDTEGNLVLILTDDFARSAREIGDLYRYRWQIELFFKWIKQHLTVKHLYGESPQAVENQIYMALINYCLLMLLKVETGFTGTLLEIQRLVKACLLEPFEAFLQQLLREKRKSKGRRKVADYLVIFKETMRQVIAGEADLDDPTYGPVIL